MKTQTSDHISFSLVIPCTEQWTWPNQISDLQNWELISRCLFMRLNLWKFVICQQKTSKSPLFESCLFLISFLLYQKNPNKPKSLFSIFQSCPLFDPVSFSSFCRMMVTFLDVGDFLSSLPILLGSFLVPDHLSTLVHPPPLSPEGILCQSTMIVVL